MSTAPLDDLEGGLKQGRKHLRQAIERIAGPAEAAALPTLGTETYAGLMRANLAIDIQIKDLSRELGAALGAKGIKRGLKRSRKSLKRVLRRLRAPKARAAISAFGTEPRDALVATGAAISNQIKGLCKDVEAALRPADREIADKATPRSTTSKRFGRTSGVPVPSRDSIGLAPGAL